MINNSQIVSGIKKFSVEFGVFKKPFSVNIYYDMAENKPIDMKFVKFSHHKRFKLNKMQKGCEKGRHNNGEWSRTRSLMYINRVTKGIRPFHLYLSVCMRCGLPHKAEFKFYDRNPEKGPKMKDMALVMRAQGKTIMSYLFRAWCFIRRVETKMLTPESSGVRRVTLEGK